VATDNVGIASLINNARANLALGIHTITFTASDLAGNRSSASSTITVVDSTAPQLSLPADIYAEATGVQTTVAMGTATASDLVAGAVTPTNNARTSYPVGTSLITWSAVDSYGNRATGTQRIVISDTTAPTLIVPADIYTEATGLQSTVAIGTATATDLVSRQLTPTSDAAATFPVATTVVTWTITDSYGNSATGTQNIIVQDTTLPTLTAPASITVAAVDAYGTPNSDPTIAAFLIGATASDTVSGNVLVTHDDPATFPPGTTTVTFSAVDGANNTATATATVIVTDQTAPVVTAPANVTVAATGQITPVTEPNIQAFLNAASASDNVDGALTPTNNTPTSFPFGTFTITFSATDAVNNTGTASATLTVQNRTAPTVTAPANVTVSAIDATGTSAAHTTIAAFLNGATSLDLLGNQLTPTHNAPTQFPLGTTTVTFSATDAYANTGTATATVTISDQIPPVVTAPTAITVAALDGYGTPATDPSIDAFLNGTTATDNINANPSITHNAGAQLPLGVTTVTFSANDGYGNIGTATSTITINDLTAPVVTAPVDLYQEASAPLTPVALGAATVRDNVDIGLTATTSKAGSFPVGTTIITWSATDAYGNIGIAIQRVIISDTTAPLLNIPVDVYVEATGTLTTVATGAATASDLVDGIITPTSNAPTTFPVGTTSVTWTAVDAYTNTATAMQNIVVQDTTAPTVTAPANITVAAVDATGTSASNATIAAFLTAATANDLVNGNVLPTHNGLTTFPVGTTTVIFSATDGQANTGTATATITIIDQTNPVVTAPTNITVAALDAYGTPASNATISTFLGAATANDNVDGTIVPSNDAPAQFPLGVTTVTFTATDAYGNAGSATATVTVQNQSAPTVTAPANLTVAALNASGTAASDPYITVFLNGATAVDLLGNVLTVSNDGLTQFPLGITTVTFSATDSYTNSGTATATITINDQTLPVVTAPAAITVAAVDGYGTAATDSTITTFLNGAIATDNVNANPTISNDAAAQLPIGTTTVIFSANDGYGNIGTATSTITIADLTLPIVTAPADIYTEATAPLTPVTPGTATVVDNVDNGLTANANKVSPFPVGLTVVTWSSTDAYGNVGTATQHVTIVDSTAPTVTTPASITVIAASAAGTPASDAAIAVFLTAARATDLVSGNVTTTHDGPTTFPVGLTTVLFSASDAYGNSASAAATVTVENPVGTLKANVYDLFAAPIAGVEVWALDAYSNRTSLLGLTDSYGQVQATLASRRYYLGVDSKALAYASGYYVSTLASGANVGLGNLPIGVDLYITANVTLILDAGQNFSGQVLNAAGLPVEANTLVRYALSQGGGMQNANNWQTVTDVYGQFSTGVHPGAYSLFADAVQLDGYGAQQAMAGGSAGGYFTGISGAVVVSSFNQAAALIPPLVINARLQAGAQVSGAVTDHYGNSVVHASVMADIYSAGQLIPTDYVVESDSYGQFALNLPASLTGQSYRLKTDHTIWDMLSMRSVSLPSGDIGGYASALAGGDVVRNGLDPYTRDLPLAAINQQVDMRLVQGATLTGVLSDSYGAVANAQLNLFDAQNSYSGQADASGRYSVNVPPAAYGVMVDGFYQNGPQRLPLANFAAGGFVDHYGQVSMAFPGLIHQLVQGQSSTLNIQLPTGGLLQGQLIDSYGNPASAAAIQAEEPVNFNSLPTASNTDGSFAMNIIPGNYRLMVPGQRWSSQGWPANWATGYVDTYGTLTDQYSFGQIFTVGTGAVTIANAQLVAGPTQSGSQTLMTVNHSPYATLADHYSQISIEATVTNSLGAPQVGVQVNFSSTSFAQFSATSAVTDGYGTARIIVTDGYAERALIDAYTVANSGATTALFLDPYADTDGDGLNNAGEFSNGTNPFDSDTDRDGFGDLQELNSGSNPNDAASSPTGAPITNGAWLTFEDAYGNGLWTDGTLWQHGIPSSGPGFAHGGNQLWATNLAGNYTSNAQAFLYLPTIDTYGMSAPTLAFYLWSATENGFDATNIEKFNPLTATWTRIDPYITAYDGSQATNNSAPGWADTTEYQLVAFDLSAYAGQQLRLRYRFSSDGSVTGAGAYLDDLRLMSEQVDYDGDGFNGVINEFSRYGTDPFVADSDGDGALDGTDISPLNPAVGFVGAYVAAPASGVIDSYAVTDGSMWQFGVPASGPAATSSVGSDPYVWATNLGGNYPANAFKDALYLPLINLNGAVNPTLSMRLWSQVEVNWDGASIEALIGGVWTVIDPYITPYGGNNVAADRAWGDAGFPAVGSVSYMLVAFDLTAYVGQQLQLRFTFSSDGSVQGSGLYLDEIRLDEEGVDADGDGIAGVLNEWSIAGTDPFIADSDGDGMVDGVDTAPLNPAVGFASAHVAAFGIVMDSYAVTGGSMWQYGVAASGPTASSGVSADPYVWATNLGGNYPTNGRNDALYLPVIDLNGAVSPTLSVRLWSQVEVNWDGADMEALIGGVWTLIDPYITTYGGRQLNVAADRAWANVGYPVIGSPSYKLAAFDLTPYAGQQLQLRFTFSSDSAAQGSGVYLDEIRLDEEGVDADSDGIAGVLNEWNLAGTDPFVADTDGDGVNDGAEIASGTDPLDPASFTNRMPVAGSDVPQSGLIAYYPLDGYGNDLTLNANHLTATNVTPVADRHGNANGAYYFNGANSMLRAVVGAEISTTNLTMAGWVRVKGSGTGNPRYFGIGPANSAVQYHALIQSGAAQGANLWYYGSGVTPDITGTSGAWSDGAWHHIAVTDNGIIRVIYIDGVAHIQSPATTALSTFTSAVVQIGRSDSGGDPVNGDMDEIRFYNRALAAHEVASLASAINVPLNNHYQINQDQYATIYLTGFDQDNNALTYSITSIPAQGSLYQTVDGYTLGAAIVNPYTQVNDPYNRVLFVPAPGTWGQPYARFNFIVNDGQVNSAPATVSIDVMANNAPTAGNDSFSQQGASLVIRSNGTSISSTFDAGIEGWTLFNDAINLTHLASGGNPGGFIQATDQGLGTYWAWQAPAKFLGDQSSSYGATLGFDLIQTPVTNQIAANDELILIGNGVTLRYDLVNPASSWTSYAVSLTEAAGWIDVATGLAPSQATMQSVLANLTTLSIRGEYNGAGGDVGSLDNVVLGNAQPGLLSNDSDPNGDPLTIIAVDTVTIQGGTVIDNGDGTYTYQSANGFIGVDTFTYTISDGVLNAVATVTINVLGTLNVINTLPGTVTGGVITITANLLDGNGTGVSNTAIRFAIPAASGGQFTANGLQSIDLYTDTSGFASADVTDTVIETVPVTVTALASGLSTVINQTFATNSGVNTTIAAANSNSVISTANGNCNTVWDLYGSPYHVTSNVSISNGCTLQVDPYVVVKFAASTAMDVNAGGTLQVNGQVGSEVIFTSVNDDAHGGAIPGSTGVPAAADWLEVKFNQGSFGSISGTKVLYGGSWSRWAGLFIHNASPTISDVTISYTTGYGLYVYSSSSVYPASPQIQNLTVTNTVRYPVYIYATSTGITQPVFTGSNSISNAPVAYAALYMNGAGVNAMISGLTLSGGKYSVQALAGAAASFSNSVLDGALDEALYLSNAGAFTMDASNTISHAAAPYLFSGQSLPVGMTPVMGAGIVDSYSAHLTGNFTASNSVMGPDPLATGNSVWKVVGHTYVANGARLQIDPYTVMKFINHSFYVQNGGVLDVYGSPAQPVIFTSVNDNAVGATLASSTGLPVAGSWGGIDYQSGSAGSMSDAEIRYANDALYVRNASPTLTNLTAKEFSLSGLHLYASNGQSTNPMLNNLLFSTADTSNYPLYLYATGTGVVAPTINGGSIITASTSASYGAIYLNGTGVSCTISGLNTSGGAYSLYARSGAGGSFTGNSFNGALNEAVYLSSAGTVALDATNSITNAAAPYLFAGQTLPAGVTPTLGVGIVDLYSAHLTGSFTAANSIIGPDPLGTGNSVWKIVGNVYVANGARLQIDPYTVMKFNYLGLYVQNGGLLDVYGSLAQPVIFTSINDDYAGAIIVGSTGSPVRGSWYGIDYESGSSGSMNYAEVRYANHAMLVRNSSPIISNLTATEFSLSGLYLQSLTSETTSPTVTNLVLSTGDTSNYPLYLQDYYNNGGVVAPTITGSSITTASTNTSYGAIHMYGMGVNAIISNMVINGGAYSLYARTGAGGTFTGNTLSGALNEAIYLSSAGTIAMNASNSITNTAAPYLFAGQALPAAVTPALGAAIVDTYSAHLTGSFTAANTVIGPDPLGSGNSVWKVIGHLYVANGARLQVDPYTVLKFISHSFYVQNGGVLDVYGSPTQPVIFTSVNDDYAGAVLASSTGVPGLGSWGGIDYQSGSSGSMNDLEIRYANDALYVRNASPVLSNLKAKEFSTSGLYLYAGSGENTSPQVNNLVLNTTDASNYPLYLNAAGTGIVSPVINGGSIVTASTNTAYGTIYLRGAGVASSINGLTTSGGVYSLYAKTGAGGTFTGNTFSGALNEAVYLAAAGAVTMDASNSITNTAAPYLFAGQTLLASLTPTLGAAIIDRSSAHLTGSFAAANTVVGPDPLGSGNSVWKVVGHIYVANGARLQIAPNTVMKFVNHSFYVQNGGVLDVYGSLAQPVIFTSMHDDVAGATLPLSTGLPTPGSWGGIDYQSGSSGSMRYTEVRYANDALYVRNASPTLNNFTAKAFSVSGLYLYASSGETTSPTVNNLLLTTTADTSNYPLYLYAAGTGIVSPAITGGSIVTASTNTAYGAIYLNGAGVAGSTNNLTTSGGAYSLKAINGAGGSFSNNVFDLALNEAIYLSGGSSPVIGANNLVSNGTAGYRLVGQMLPATVYAQLAAAGTNMSDPYSLRISGTLPAGSSNRLSSDPLATGQSVWLVVSDLIIPSGASLAVDPYTVVKLTPWNTDIWVDGVMDVYGQPSAPVIFTSINDDSAGAILPTSTGLPSPQDWGDVGYRSSASGGMNFAEMRYGYELYINNASPTLQDVTVLRNISNALHIQGSSTTIVTAPVINNLSVTEPSSHALYIHSNAATTLTQPVFGGVHNINKTATNSIGIYVVGAGVTTTINNAFIRGFDTGIRIETGATVAVNNSLTERMFSNGFALGLSAQTGVLKLSNNRVLNSQSGAGIQMGNVAAGTVLEHNLIRGNNGQNFDYGGGIRVSSTVTTNPTIRNNLIVENSAAYSLASAGINVLAGATVTLEGNTIADNRITSATADGAGVRALTTANVTMRDNVIAGNQKNGVLNDLFSTATLTGSYNLIQDGRVNNGLNDIYAAPQFAANWYLGATSLALDADVTQVITVPWLAGNPYAQPSLADTGNLDLGYHHPQPSITVDAALSTVTPTALNQAGAATAVVITIVPKDANGTTIGAGLQLQGSLGASLTGATVVWPIHDLGDGSYAITITPGTIGQGDLLTITASGTVLMQTVSLLW